ncbi:hypothetical protein C4D60_Mb07t03210 [Musa balbisiana]|uniref:Uncharacterized protein n=1 Tax=Musa balbisiana TaxID=52838 RepID=A0A4S8JEG8_MUSBA|nr:hypothetical protein C4D60_Mb07t03210 [Musa balbisiana]
MGLRTSHHFLVISGEFTSDHARGPIEGKSIHSHRGDDLKYDNTHLGHTDVFRTSNNTERPSMGVIHLLKATIGQLFHSTRKGVQNLFPREYMLEALNDNATQT